MNSIYKYIIVILVVITLCAAGYFGIRSQEEIQRDSVPAASGKLNINVVCESALAYMSFPDGASADKFVAECKEGKHPNVIEEYKKRMGLGDGAAI